MYSEKLIVLADIEGYDSVDALLNDNMCGESNHGICTNPGCEYTTSTEPDSTTGWCEECRTNTVSNALQLAGIF